METIHMIDQAIQNDPENKQYTEAGIKPLYAASERSKILIVGQAPGLKAQQTHRLFNDASGERLCNWLGITDAQLHDTNLFSILPMDFYFPGKGTSGDLPPRKDFADKWHLRLMQAMPDIQLTLLLGAYAQKHYLGKSMRKNSTETIRHYQDYLPQYFPLIHPSPLNARWMSKNRWFEENVLPDLAQRVHKIID